MKTFIKNLLLCMGITLVGCENDKSADWSNLCGQFNGNNLEVSYRNKVYTSSESNVMNVDIWMPEATGRALDSDTLQLNLKCPLFPNENDFLFKVVPSHTSRGTMLNGVYMGCNYELQLEGFHNNEKLELQLTYKSTNDKLVGNSYLFHFNTEAIDTRMSGSIIFDYKGEEQSISPFLHEALAPMLDVMAQRFGKSVRMTFLEDGMLQLEAKQASGDTFIPIAGLHGFCLHSTHHTGFIYSDDEGASYVSEKVGDNQVGNKYYTSHLYVVDGLYKYIPIFYGIIDSDLVIYFYADGYRKLYSTFLDEWVQSNASNLSDEQQAKINKLVSLYNEGWNGMIGFRGIQE